MRAPRDDDAEALRHELRAGHRLTGLPVLFGGLVSGGRLPLIGFVGTHGSGLRGLVIGSELGLGGRTVAERRPGSVVDYAHSTEITHEYDREVAGEGIKSLAAAPAVVGGTTRAVIYGGLRSASTIGDAVLARMTVAARRLAREIEVRDEVDRRLALIATTRNAEQPLAPGVADGIVESVIALGEIASTTTDPALAGQLREVVERLRRLGTQHRADADLPAAVVHLSPREHEVLNYLAVGCSNAEIAQRLRLRTDSVKGYVRNLFAKLDVHNRHEAVVSARRLGLLP